MCKRGLSGFERSNIVILHKEGYSERKLSEKLKFSNTAIHQKIVIFRKFGSFYDYNRIGRTIVTSSRDECTRSHVRAKKLNLHCCS